jgi:zinc/manganese transport system permease protein
MISILLADPVFKRALVSGLLVSLSGAPLGVFLVLRRMALMGDVMAHAILPGVAAGFILAGMSLPAMSFGGLVAGLCVALLAGIVTRVSAIREDASLTAFYLMAVALGVLMIALHGSAQDLEDVLFGSPTALDAQALTMMAGVTTVTLLALALIYRPLVVECFDPIFLRAMRGRGGFVHSVFLTLVVLNMVESYRALGTLMAAGLMLIPAIAAQFWTRRLPAMIALAAGIAATGSTLGLGIAFLWKVPSGPAIVLVLGAIYIGSLIGGRHGSVAARYFPFRHFEH